MDNVTIFSVDSGSEVKNTALNTMTNTSFNLTDQALNLVETLCITGHEKVNGNLK